jgi:transposase
MSSQEPAGPDGPRAGQRKRRTFTAEYKLRILAEYDRAREPGARGALLRREGLYHSNIQGWRRAVESGAAAAVSPKAGPKKPDPETVENRRLRKENDRLKKELDKAQAVMEILGKTHALLEILSESADTQTP